MTNELQKLPAMEDRPETGAMQFGDDWPGVFIRGDVSLMYACLLEVLLPSLTREHAQDEINYQLICGLINLMRSCEVKPSSMAPPENSWPIDARVNQQYNGGDSEH